MFRAYVKIKLINDEPVHCHGLFSLFLHIYKYKSFKNCFTPRFRYFSFANKNKIVRNFYQQDFVN